MNPPFNGTEYIKHILHAQKFLSRNGVLVTVTPTGWTKLEQRSVLAETLYDKAVTNSSEYMDPSNFFEKGTFPDVSIETTLCVIDSIEIEQAYLASDLAKDAAMLTFNLVVDNDQTLHKRRHDLLKDLAHASLDTAKEEVSQFVSDVLGFARNSGTHVNPRFIREIVKSEISELSCIQGYQSTVELKEQPSLCF
jgi:hypothetical protein